MLSGDSPTKVKAEVYNFGSETFSCKLRLHIPEGWSGAIDDGEISIEPMGRVVRELEISADTEASPEPDQIRVDAVDLSGEARTFTVAWIAVKKG